MWWAYTLTALESAQAEPPEELLLEAGHTGQDTLGAGTTALLGFRRVEVDDFLDVLKLIQQGVYCESDTLACHLTAKEARES